MQMSTRDHIVQEIMLSEVIYSRKAALDDILDGLCVLRFHELFQNFTEEFGPVFAAVEAEKVEVTPCYLLDMLRSDCSLDEDEATLEHLKAYIRSLDNQGTAQAGHYSSKLD